LLRTYKRVILLLVARRTKKAKQPSLGA